MYAFLKGTLIEASPTVLILEVHGVGYQLFIPLNDFGDLPAFGETLQLYTTFIVREMAHSLYGFLKRGSRDLFEVLITISGIGPKIALGIVGHLSIDDFYEIVTTNNASRFARIPGIGKRTAERLLLELQGKLKIPVSHAGSAIAIPSSQAGDALDALIQLGLTQSVAEKAVKKAVENLGEDYDLSTLISTALKFR